MTPKLFAFIVTVIYAVGTPWIVPALDAIGITAIFLGTAAIAIVSYSFGKLITEWKSLL